MTITVTAKIVDPELAAKFQGVEVRISVVERPTEDAIGYLEPDEARKLASDILAAAQTIDDARIQDYTAGPDKSPSDISAELIYHSAGAGSPRCEIMVDASEAINTQDKQIYKLDEALSGLANNMAGLRVQEDAIRDVIGNTNWEVLEHWIKQADAVTSAKGPA